MLVVHGCVSGLGPRVADVSVQQGLGVCGSASPLLAFSNIVRAVSSTPSGCVAMQATIRPVKPVTVRPCCLWLSCGLLPLLRCDLGVASEVRKRLLRSRVSWPQSRWQRRSSGEGSHDVQVRNPPNAESFASN